jgi:hypothetical protein
MPFKTSLLPYGSSDFGKDASDIWLITADLFRELRYSQQQCILLEVRVHHSPAQDSTRVLVITGVSSSSGIDDERYRNLPRPNVTTRYF